MDASFDERSCFVSNLPNSLIKEDIEELFTQVGPVENVLLKAVIGRDNSRQNQFAIVTFEHVESVLFAIACLDGISCFDTKIVVRPKRDSQREILYKNRMQHGSKSHPMAYSSAPSSSRYIHDRPVEYRHDSNAYKPRGMQPINHCLMQQRQRFHQNHYIQVRPQWAPEPMKYRGATYRNHHERYLNLAPRAVIPGPPVGRVSNYTYGPSFDVHRINQAPILPLQVFPPPGIHSFQVNAMSEYLSASINFSKR